MNVAPSFTPRFHTLPVAHDLRARQAARAAQLNRRYEALSSINVLRGAIEREFRGRIALVSSFGAESAVLLDLVAQVDPHLPIIFLDTGKLFGETLRYRDQLVGRLGLTDVRSIRPDPDEVEAEDADGILWRRNPDACCDLRKTRPMDRALEGFDAWITGRKRYQSATRTGLDLFEASGRFIKINPLITWSAARLQSYLADNHLPPHPLVEDGYPSIGCMPCTDRVEPGADPRSGRWAGTGKTECGIHIDGDGI